MYMEPIALDASMNLNSHFGTLVQVPSKQEFLWTHPGFYPTAKTDHLSGCITVEGFTVNIHPFVAKLMDRIVELGGEFLWDCHVQGIQRNSHGEVTMLESPLGYFKVDHFVISPGVAGNKLLRGTACENLIQGVLGVWMQIPNLHPQVKHLCRRWSLNEMTTPRFLLMGNLDLPCAVSRG